MDFSFLEYSVLVWFYCRAKQAYKKCSKLHVQMIRNVRKKGFHKQMAIDWTYLCGKVMCVHSESTVIPHAWLVEVHRPCI